MHKSVGSDEIHPRVLRELVDEVAKPLSVESLYTEWLRDKGHDGMPLVKQ